MISRRCLFPLWTTRGQQLFLPSSPVRIRSICLAATVCEFPFQGGWESGRHCRSSNGDCHHQRQRQRQLGVMQGATMMQQQQRRSYLYLPTSFKEFELRFLRDFTEERTINVRLKERRGLPNDNINKNNDASSLESSSLSTPVTSANHLTTAAPIAKSRQYYYEKTKAYYANLSNRVRDRYYAARFRWRGLRRRRQFASARRRRRRTIAMLQQSSSTLPLSSIPHSIPSWCHAKAATLRTRSTRVGRHMVRRTRRWSDTLQQQFIHRQQQFMRRRQHFMHRSRQALAARVVAAGGSSSSSLLAVAAPPPSIATSSTTTFEQHQHQLPVTITEYSEADWFCPVTGRPRASRDPTGRFVNPWLSQSTDGVKSPWEIIVWQWERFQRTIQDYVEYGRLPIGGAASTTATTDAIMAMTTATTGKPKSSSSPPIPFMSASVPIGSRIGEQTVATQSTSSVSATTAPTAVPPKHNKEDAADNALRLTWIGHATCLVQHEQGITMLTDPIFSIRCSPFQSLPVGVARDVPPAVSIEDLPPIDVCLISHDHYDHLDKDSVLSLRDKVEVWIVPTGIREWLVEKCDLPVDRIVELEWWESVKLQRKRLCESNDGTKNHDSEKVKLTQQQYPWKAMAVHSAVRDNPVHPALKDLDLIVPHRHHSPRRNDFDSMWVTCCPAQHWASRTFFDRNFRLWCSFCVFLPGSKFFFGGDTAFPKYFPLFQQIRDFVGGSIDLCALPVGAYEPEFYNRDSHMNPSQAVKVHQALDAKRSVGIHWGTFALSEEPMDEPPVKLQQAAKVANVDFATIGHGETIAVASRLYHE